MSINNHNNSSSSNLRGLNNNSKRKRVLRACDECRRKKVKCDGQSPCVHCKVYSYRCTYNQPANKKAKNFQAVLQNKLNSFELFLTAVFPEIDLDKISNLQETDQEQLKSILETSLAKNNKSDSSIIILNKFVENFNSNSFTDSNNDSSPPVIDSNVKFETNERFSNTISDDGFNRKSTSKVVKISLPPLEEALELVHCACNSALLFKFYNRLNLIKIVEKFYDTGISLETLSDDNNHNKKLAFIYSFLAVGALLKNNPKSYDYYNAAHSLIRKKLVETTDILNIQTLFCLIIFLQCTANLSTCYSFVGIALRSAFRIGLHRKIESDNAIAQENRKRLFWSIYKIDVYMNTVLGLPQISDDQIDQDLPLDIEDEYITETAYLTPKNKNKQLTTIAISNDHTKLIMILNHIVKNVYPINTDSYYKENVKDGSNFRDHSFHSKTNFIYVLIGKVKLMEEELEKWLNDLPIELNPDNTNIPVKFYKQNRLLKLAYLHVQLALYRPFIHLISHKFIQIPNINQDSLKYGMNCINVAIRIVELATEMHEHELLNGAYWFSIYPIFYSVACLVYYIHENSNTELNVNVSQITKYAEKGKDVLVDLKQTSMAAARTYQTLNVMFEQLNRRTKKFHTNHQKYFEDHQKENNNSTTQINNDSIITNPQPSFQLDFNSATGNLQNSNNNNNQIPKFNINLNTPDMGFFNSNDSIDQRYFGGMVDKLDMNLFGRFLPPYMLESKSNNNNFSQQMSKSDSNLNRRFDDNSGSNSITTPLGSNYSTAQMSLSNSLALNSNNNNSNNNSKNNSNNNVVKNNINSMKELGQDLFDDNGVVFFNNNDNHPSVEFSGTPTPTNIDPTNMGISSNNMFESIGSNNPTAIQAIWENNNNNNNRSPENKGEIK